MRQLTKWLLEPSLVLAVLALTCFGVAMIYSAGVVHIPNDVTQNAWIRQGTWFVLAVTVFIVVVRVPVRWIEWVALPSYTLSILLLVSTLVVGTGVGTAAGVKSWIQIGSFSFQPSEIAKIATILFLARFLSQRKDPLNSVQDLLLPALLVGLPLALVMLQPDLGTAIAFGGILFAMFFWAGTPVILLLLIASPVLGLMLSYDTIIWSGYMVALVGFLYLFRYRLLLFESVGVDPRGAGYQLIQSKVAVGSGGVMGQGFTLGSQKRYDFLPEQHTDFIFSVVGEELGFIGTALGILAFSFILGRLVHMATRTPDPFAGLVVLGIFGAWLAHIFVNIGMTVGVVPITGIPLPFVSYGGTFLLMCWISLAIAVRVAHEG